MHRIVSKLIVFVCSLFVVSSVWAEATEFYHVPSSIYVPVGFDTNDNSQVVIEGQFNNSCYRAGATEYKVDYLSKTIFIKNKAQKYNSDFCLMVLLDYKKEINLGILSQQGEYNIQFATEEKTARSLGVLRVNEATTESADDYLYTQVTKVRYVKNDPFENGYLELKGKLSNSCMKLDRVEVTRPNQGVIQVLPVANYVESENCQVLRGDQQISFTHNVSLKGYGKGRVLIHVRSLNGQAVNLIEQL